MAIIKEIINDRDGLSADYWKLGMVSIDVRMQEASMSVNLYYSKEHSVQDRDGFITSVNCSVLLNQSDKTLYNKYFNDTTAYPNWKQACYRYILENESYFADGVFDEEVTK